MTPLARAALVLALGCMGGCDEIGNPIAGTGAAELVRTTDTGIGRLVTAVRAVAPREVETLVGTLGAELDHLDRVVPHGGTIVLVEVQAAPNAPRPPALQLVSDFVLPGGLVERRVWVASGARFVALFGLRANPTDVRTSPL